VLRLLEHARGSGRVLVGGRKGVSGTHLVNLLAGRKEKKEMVLRIRHAISPRFAISRRPTAGGDEDGFFLVEPLLAAPRAQAAR
jgi:hypothetical protein